MSPTISDVLDSSALLAYILGEPGEDQVEAIFKKARTERKKLALSVIQYGEISYILTSRLGTGVAKYVRESLHGLPLRIVPVTARLALEAAAFKVQGGIAYADCFALALAAQNNARIITKDAEFKKFEKQVKLQWIGK